MPNRLIHETSPYLLQHAHNPVDWYPWGEEAFDLARREDKPILLSVGYSACHWCHVMEHESFENEDIATLMNRHFVSIKVDREERPDIDSIYMAAVQAMTQRGGWPMTVFLTPDGKPFYGGTYYPPEDRMGMPGFPRVLTAIAEAYAGRREEILRSGESIVEHLQRQAAPPAGGEQFDPKLLQETAAALPYYVDRTEGGFGTAPKFPQPMVLDYLLRLYRRTQDPDFLQMAEHTLTKMARGGMYDQLGGGFHRYSTDARWLVPHFEKMLYDNAQLAQVYLHAFQITGRALYRRVAEEILDYVRREMTSSEGAFYSTQDADSEGQEGKFFVWTLDEVQRTLGDAAAEPFVRYYDVTEHGNWEGLNILHVALEPEAVAAQLGMSLADLDISLEHSRQLLLAQREQRIHPGRDDKALTSWNGMMLKAFAEAGAILARPDYTEMARANARFLLGTMLKDGKLLRTYKDGRAKLNGYLEDYANLVDGLLRLYESTFELAWFESARALAASMIERFWSAEERCFYDTSADHETLIKRPRDVFDNATPSGTSVAAEDLLRLYFFTADDSYRSIGEAVLAGLQESATNYPLGFGRLCSAADLFAGPTREVAIIGRPGSPDAANLLHAAWSTYSPNAVLAGADPTDAAALQAIAILQDRPLVGDQAAAYVCEAFVCQAPITNPAGLQTALRA